MSESSVVYKTVAPLQVAAMRAIITSRAEIPPLLERVRRACGDAICGPAMAILEGGAVKTGLVVDAAYPVSRPVQGDDGNIQTSVLQEVPVLTMLHYGRHDSIRETVLRIYEYVEHHSRTVTNVRREIYLTLNPAHPEGSVTELQVVMHAWDRLLADGVERVLGSAARDQVMAGAEDFSYETSADEYSAWLRTAMERIDVLTGDPRQKFEMVACCAHVFPEERIAYLRSVYEQAHDVDAVLREMYDDYDWYEGPVRRGNVIHMVKIPFDQEAYTRATTPEERRLAYCHCSFVRPYLNEIPPRLSPTFCWCGAGWYKRLWEGILGRPVQIEHGQSVLRGDERCTVLITLPITAEGEQVPPPETLPAVGQALLGVGQAERGNGQAGAE